MEGFIDRLADFLRSLLGSDGEPSRGGAQGAESAHFRDPDLQDAWEELDDYMRTGKSDPKRNRESPRARRPVDESLRQDYANLEVPFGADIETVRKSYKTLILKYHPDKFAGDPQKQKVALEITKKINESFERIRSRHEA
ncbi:MAG: J domain-containing protein [Spirochaetia bacterium]